MRDNIPEDVGHFSPEIAMSGDKVSKVNGHAMRSHSVREHVEAGSAVGTVVII